MGGARGMYTGEEKSFKVLKGKPYGKKPLRISRCRCEDTIKMYLKQ
jgi:hypothetical protein